MNKQPKMPKVYGMGTEYNYGGATEWLFDGSGTTSPKASKNGKTFDSDGSEGISDSGAKKKYYGSAIKGSKENSTGGGKIEAQLREKVEQMRKKVEKLEEELSREKKNFDRMLNEARQQIFGLQESQRMSQLKIMQLEEQNNDLIRQSVSLQDQKKIIEDEILIQRQKHQSELAMKESEWSQRAQRLSQEKKEKFKREQAELISTYEAKLQSERQSQYENSRKLSENTVSLTRANQALIREKKELINYHKKLTEQLQSNLQVSQGEVAGLKNQIQLIINKHQRQLSQLRERHQKQINDEQGKITDLLKKIQLQNEMHSNQINQLSQDHQNTLQEMRHSFDVTVGDYEAKLTQKQEECEVLMFRLEEEKRMHANQIEKLILHNEKEAARMVHELENLIKEYEDKIAHKDQLHNLNIQNKINQLNLIHQISISQLKQQHQTQMSQMKAELQNAVAEYQAKLNLKAIQNQKILNQVKSQNQNFTQKLQLIQQKIDQLKTAFCVEVSQEEYLKLYQELEDTQDQLDSLSEEYEISPVPERKKYFKPKKLRHNSIFSTSSSKNLEISHTVNIQSSTKPRNKLPHSSLQSQSRFDFLLRLGIY